MARAEELTGLGVVAGAAAQVRAGRVERQHAGRIARQVDDAAIHDLAVAVLPGDAKGHRRGSAVAQAVERGGVEPARRVGREARAEDGAAEDVGQRRRDRGLDEQDGPHEEAAAGGGKRSAVRHDVHLMSANPWIRDGARRGHPEGRDCGRAYKSDRAGGCRGLSSGVAPAVQHGPAVLQGERTIARGRAYPRRSRSTLSTRTASPGPGRSTPRWSWPLPTPPSPGPSAAPRRCARIGWPSTVRWWNRRRRATGRSSIRSPRPTSGPPMPWSGCPTCTSPSRTRRPTARGWSRPSRSTCCRCGSTRSSRGVTWCWSPPPIAGSLGEHAPEAAARRGPWRQVALLDGDEPVAPAAIVARPAARPRGAGRGIS